MTILAAIILSLHCQRFGICHDETGGKATDARDTLNNPACAKATPEGKRKLMGILIEERNNKDNIIYTGSLMPAMKKIFVPKKGDLYNDTTLVSNRYRGKSFHVPSFRSVGMACYLYVSPEIWNSSLANISRSLTNKLKK